MSKIATKTYHYYLKEDPYFLEYYKTVTPQKTFRTTIYWFKTN